MKNIKSETPCCKARVVTTDGTRTVQCSLCSKLWNTFTQRKIVTYSATANKSCKHTGRTSMEEQDRVQRIAEGEPCLYCMDEVKVVQ